MLRTVFWILILLAMTAAASAARGEKTPLSTGFIVAAPDRGFTGNEEVRDLFLDFAEQHTAELVFVTDERTAKNMAHAVARLAEQGAERIVVLPLFLTAANPRFTRLCAVVDRLGSLPRELQVAPVFGDHYLAVEILADRLRAVENPEKTQAIVIGNGARDETSRTAMSGDLERLARAAAADLGLAGVQARVWMDSTSDDITAQRNREETELRHLAAESSRTVIVPYHLGRKLDRMMAFDSELKQALPAGSAWLEGGVTPHAAAGQWLAQAAAHYLPLTPASTGLVIVAHGADWHWNETMRRAAAPLAEEYLVEYAFTMADQPSIERAVHRLAARGAQAAVVIRVFVLADSFRHSVERMLGMDHGLTAPSSGGHGHAGPTEPRIRAAIPMTTIGGLEDHPLFAQALLDRARALSKNPEKEVVVLVGHGAREDERDRHWQGILASLANQMRDLGGAEFAAIETGTWREDWPEKRQAAVERIRAIVKRATQQGKQVLVIPARINGQGAEHEFLDGLDYRLGEGFAPHPLFADWLREQAAEGLKKISNEEAPPWRECE